MNKYSNIQSLIELENEEGEDQERKFDLVHVGVVLAYMAITATILLLLFASINNNSFIETELSMGKAEPAFEETPLGGTSEAGEYNI